MNAQQLVESLTDELLARPRSEPGPRLLALCGWADTGKTTIARLLIAHLRQRGLQADGFSTDSFLLERAERQARGLSGYDPRSLNAAGLVQALLALRQGDPVTIRPYCNRLGRQLEEGRLVQTGDVLVLEGIHALHASLCPGPAFSLFLDADDAVLSWLRAQANQHKRGMSADQARARIPEELRDYSQHVRPQRRHAHRMARVDMDYHYHLT
ncbi:uridine kinase family protein [Inhella proteolytica]|uniref:Phosphoribulokinase/uridine kinase domain-containing protein n=1 Tax=Inhella proteolytica TaxID=2795029 RepID=A0A931J5B3_9BURK|nr:hypothetical protein [Inhella proteolytica]MBH9578485.1 hypothetical protein [Inhella proteolytica]